MYIFWLQETHFTSKDTDWVWEDELKNTHWKRSKKKQESYIYQTIDSKTKIIESHKWGHPIMINEKIQEDVIKANLFA